jgi:hypothetical protein
MLSIITLYQIPISSIYALIPTLFVRMRRFPGFIVFSFPIQIILGCEEEFPLMTVTCAVNNYKESKFDNIYELTEYLASLKTYAKRL